MVDEDHSLGAVSVLSIEHDCAGPAAAWHLDHITVSDVNSGCCMLFSCCAWLVQGNNGERPSLRLESVRHAQRLG